MQELKVNVTLFSETRLRFCIPIYLIHRIECQDGHKGRTVVALKKASFIHMWTLPAFSRSYRGLHTDWTYKMLPASTQGVKRHGYCRPDVDIAQNHGD
jgi:hypothetical protein